MSDEAEDTTPETEAMPVDAASAAPAVKTPWSEADRRILLITVAGGLAANLGTVLLIGCAVLLDKLLASYPGIATKGYVLPAVIILAINAAIWLAYFRNPARKRSSSRGDRVASVGAILFNLVALLVIVGYVAGVK